MAIGRIVRGVPAVAVGAEAEVVDAAAVAAGGAAREVQEGAAVTDRIRRSDERAGLLLQVRYSVRHRKILMHTRRAR